jgi:hypothetical protein
VLCPSRCCLIFTGYTTKILSGDQRRFLSPADEAGYRTPVSTVHELMAHPQEKNSTTPTPSRIESGFELSQDAAHDITKNRAA